jgi:hypothetical protein
MLDLRFKKEGFVSAKNCCRKYTTKNTENLNNVDKPKIVQKGKYLAKGFKKGGKSKVLWRISLDKLLLVVVFYCGASETINLAL